ncbi:adhesion G-protein coupled receptor D2-like [Acipenser oxyrinchus oxyrinchus]|uniref:Adhesion G-protein coupled receptor D2-like n=1 Tax=Acipenser oxyrinchus oxyrinchus TaxID=40147 RepID=A0AAD8CRP5_ACIOX|nr:adhesion G-protein coupled receptor D2-like [Acipenser oxyrinchus oxyrinchus]
MASIATAWFTTSSIVRGNSETDLVSQWHWLQAVHKGVQGYLSTEDVGLVAVRPSRQACGVHGQGSQLLSRYSPPVMELVLQAQVCRLIGTSASWEHRNISEDLQLSQTVLQTPDGVFEYVNVSLDFRHAERYCRQQFSLLPNDTSQDDLESTKKLLLAMGVSDPVWLRDSSAHTWGHPWFTAGQNSPLLLPILMFQEITHTKYAKVELHFPALSEITVCAWVQWDNKSQGVSTVFSYAEPFFINAFQLRGQTDEYGNINMALIVRGHHTPYKTLLRNDGEWHHLCVTWQKAKGIWAIYIDREKGNSGSGLYASNDINGDGMFIIGQDQDTLGGTFNEAFCGNITALNIWNKSLSEEQVAGVSPCSMIMQNQLFHWDVTKITIEATVGQSLMKFMCPGKVL